MNFLMTKPEKYKNWHSRITRGVEKAGSSGPLAKPVARVRAIFVGIGTVAKCNLEYENPTMLSRSREIARWIFIVSAIYGIPVLGS
jgi:hypothetical protein